MQILTNLTKYLLFIVLSCSLLFTWNTDIPNLSLLATPDYDASSVSPNASIWSMMSRDFELDHKANYKQVQAEIRKLLADQDKLQSILKAAQPYIYFIYKQTQARGLPAELALIPVIESEFNPNDKSNKGATGLWQLMPGTARELGIQVKGSYDGRRNVIASTQAALAYFKDLGFLFKGNWYLAIAAYNSGQGRVESAMKRKGSDDFWNLKLPRETQLYVPKLLAVAAIVKNPEKYGVELPPIENQPYFAEVKFKKSVNLASIAKKAGIDERTLHTLNPDFKQATLAPSKGKETLLVPISKAPAVVRQV